MLTPEQRINIIQSVFTPSYPIETQDLFAGRTDSLVDLVNIIDEKGLHGALYGDRGVGKTSMANVVNEIVGAVNDIKAPDTVTYLSSKINCERSDSFNSLWRRILGKINFEYQYRDIGFTAKEKTNTAQLSIFLKASDEYESEEIVNILEKLNSRLVLIFDEFDLVEAPEVKQKFSDTLKLLSDSCPNVTVLVVGIATNIIDLIGEHPSLSRCLRQVKLPKMSSKELHEIIEKGLNNAKMTIDKEIAEKIVKFSDGYPHYTHLLSKHCAIHCITDHRTHIQGIDLDDSISKAIRHSSASIKESFQKATISSKPKSMFKKILRACALATEDEYGTFRSTDVHEATFEVDGKKIPIQSFVYHLGNFCKPERGSILERIEIGKQTKYKFRNPLLKAYVLLDFMQSQQNSSPRLF